MVIASVELTHHEVALLRDLQRDEVKYFPVIRQGIQSEPREMRFGRCLWSEKDGEFKYQLYLVESTYDSKPNPVAGLLEPPMSNVERLVSTADSAISALLNLLVSRGTISPSDKEEVLERAMHDGRARRTWQFDQVKDLDEYVKMTEI